MAIDLLITKEVVPVVVFDGKDLEAKAGTKDKRVVKRRQAKAKALHYIYQKGLNLDPHQATMGAKLAADQAIAVTNEIVEQVILVNQ
jgi:hypothetical protein